MSYYDSLLRCKLDRLKIKDDESYPENSILYYDVSKINYTDNDVVTYLEDLSGMGKHAVQDKTVPMPIYKFNVINGKPVLRFSDSQGLNYLFTQPTLETLDVDFSLYVVGTNNLGNGKTLIAFTHNSSGSAPILFRRLTDGQNVYTTRGVLSTTYQQPQDTFVIHSINKINGVLEYRVNNQILGILPQNTFSLTGNARGISLGYWDNNNSPAQFLNGDIAFVLAYKQGFSSSVVDEINQTLSSKYNIPLI